MRSDTFIPSGLIRMLTILTPLCASRYVGLEAARKIGEALVARGLSQAAEPTSFSEDELKVYYGLYVRSLSLFLVSSLNDSQLRCPDHRSLLLSLPCGRSTPGQLRRDQLAGQWRPFPSAWMVAKARPCFFHAQS